MRTEMINFELEHEFRFFFFTFSDFRWQRNGR